jgi:hypothetical protein
MVGAKDTQRGRRMRLTRWETSDMGRLEVEIKTGPGPVPADIMLSGVRGTHRVYLAGEQEGSGMPCSRTARMSTCACACLRPGTSVRPGTL